MDGVKLADRLAYGAGCAARRTGFLHDAFRPDGPETPIELEKRFLRLCVTYLLPSGAVNAPAGLGMPYRQAWADWSYLQTGDYLVGPEGTSFVVQIEPPKPMLVVMTNATLDILRPAAPVLAGLNQYGAVVPDAATVLLRGFPASLMSGGVGDKSKAGLPDDMRGPGFVAILPAVADIIPRVADLVLDEQSRKYSVSAVEVLGSVWRLSLARAVS